MYIDEKMISYLEDLACLTLCDDEKSRLANDLEKILNGITGLSELNTDGVPEYSHPYETNVLRDDEVIPSLNRDLILQNASVKNDEFFIAPKTVD